MFGRSRRAVPEGAAYQAYDPAAPAPPGAGASAGGGAVGAVPSRTMPASSVVNPGAGAGLGMVGFLTMLLGAWVGISPFVGPLFFNAFGVPAWTWNLTNAIVWLAPGAVCFVIGISMMTAASAARAGVGGRSHLGTGLLAGCCGAWLLIAPIAWPVAEGRIALMPSTPWREFLYWVSYTFGPGALLVLFGGIAMGVAMLTRRATMVATAPVSASNERVAA